MINMSDFREEIPLSTRFLCEQTDPDLFLDEAKNRSNLRMAKLICGRCSDALDCLEDKLNTPASQDDSGVFGGTSPKQRQIIRSLYNGGLHQEAAEFIARAHSRNAALKLPHEPRDPLLG